MILYYDAGRSRLFEGEDAVYDLPGLRDLQYARFWCASNRIEFYDHSIANYPEWMRPLLLAARAVTTEHVRPKSLWWLPCEFPPDEAWSYAPGNRVPSRSQAKSMLPRSNSLGRAPSRQVAAWMMDDDGKDIWYPVNAQGERMTGVTEQPPG